MLVLLVAAILYLLYLSQTPEWNLFGKCHVINKNLLIIEKKKQKR
mgnify:CR=1 FL=1